MMLTATEGATQLPPSRVAGMPQKPNPTMATERNTATKMRVGPQYRVECHLILLNERLGAVVLMPILAKAENFRECYKKSARFSAMIESLFCMSSSYPIDAKASTG
jgi:hypothetical protein